MSYFRQLIFPPLLKPVVIERSVATTDIKARAILETIYCIKNDKWLSMVECINCKHASKTLEEILEFGVGCMGD